MRPIASEQIDQVSAALVAAQGQLNGATKDSTNPHFRSKYADLTSVWDACRSALQSAGLAVAQLPLPANEEYDSIVLRTVLLHASGQFLASEIPLDCDLGKPQSIGSAITYARRYALAAMVGVCPEDDDGEAAMGRNGNGHANGNTNGNGDRRPIPPPAAKAPDKPDTRSYAQLVADGAAAHVVKTMPVHRELLGEAVADGKTKDPGGLVDDASVVEIMTTVHRHDPAWTLDTLKRILRRHKAAANAS